jgi:hypothetical protein
MSDEFYVTLLSGVQHDVDTELNHPEDFTNRMPKTISLDENWEVGVTQLHFDNCMRFRTPEFKFLAFLCEYKIDWEADAEYDDDEDLEPILSYDLPEERRVLAPSELSHLYNISDYGFVQAGVHTQFITLPAGLWDSILAFRIFVGLVLSEAYNVKILYNLTSEGFGILHSRPMYIGFSSIDDRPFALLGMHPRSLAHVNDNKFLYGFGEKNPPHREVVVPTCRSVCVYSDIVQKQFVGTRFSNMLIRVPVTTEFGQLQSNFYKAPAYQSLEHTTFSEIRVCLRDDQDLPLRFVDNRRNVSLQLHFRRRKRCLTNYQGYINQTQNYQGQSPQEQSQDAFR